MLMYVHTYVCIYEHLKEISAVNVFLKIVYHRLSNTYTIHAKPRPNFKFPINERHNEWMNEIRKELGKKNWK